MTTVYEKYRELAPDFRLQTPVQKLTEMGALLGLNNLYIKRDDLSDFYCGKTRHARFIIAWLREQEVISVELIGPGHSDALRVYGMALKRAGIPFRYSLLSDPAMGNGRVIKMLCPAEKEGEFKLRYDEHKDVASLGYVECAEELLKQMPEIDRIYLYSYDGGWIGLSIGFHAYWKEAPSLRKRPLIVAARGKGAPHGHLGSMTDKAYLQNVYARGAVNAGQLNAISATVDLREFDKGYGAEAIDLMLNSEGILLDPVYTGPAFQALMDDAETGKIGKDETVLFINTGGFFLNF